MKITVSIPDELWLSVRRDGEPSSTTVQEGLRLLSGTRNPDRVLENLHDYGSPEDPGDSDGSVLIERFRAEAERRLQLGREVAQDFAAKLSWEELERLPDTETALAAMLRNEFLTGDPASSNLLKKLDEALNQWNGVLTGIWDDDGGPLDSPTVFEGIAQVLCALQQKTVTMIRAGAASPSEDTSDAS